jgi:hypothetical protein
VRLVERPDEPGSWTLAREYDNFDPMPGIIQVNMGENRSSSRRIRLTSKPVNASGHRPLTYSSPPNPPQSIIPTHNTLASLARCFRTSPSSAAASGLPRSANGQ